MKGRPTGGNKAGTAQRRRASAAVELALLLPVLCYICVVTIDYSRLFFAWSTIAECAYNGAYWMADSNIQTSSGWTSVQQAALADASNISPSPTVTASALGTDSAGNTYYEVTVTYVFTTQFNYPGIPTSTTISRKIRMAVTPS